MGKDQRLNLLTEEDVERIVSDILQKMPEQLSLSDIRNLICELLFGLGLNPDDEKKTRDYVFLKFKPLGPVAHGMTWPRRAWNVMMVMKLRLFASTCAVPDFKEIRPPEARVLGNQTFRSLDVLE